MLIDLILAGQCVRRCVRLRSASCSTRVLLSNEGAMYTKINRKPCHKSVYSTEHFGKAGQLTGRMSAFAGGAAQAASLQSALRSKKPSLAESHPDLVNQWHPTKNGDRKPEHFTAGSTARVWWLCPEPCSSCGGAHDWESDIHNRTREGMPTGCPFCCRQRVCECSSLAALRPDVMMRWDYAGNKGLDPEQISLQSNRKVSWMCPSHGTWTALVYHRVKGSACPQCAVQSRVGSKRGPLRDEHPELVAQLHPTKNAHIDFEKVTSGSPIKAVWVCHDRQNAPAGCTHAHEWTTEIRQRTGNARRKGSGCPYCSGRVVCPCNSLAVKAPEVAAQWHPTRNGNKHPDNVGPFSNLTVWWQHTSELTGDVHDWKAQVYSRVMTWQSMKRLSCRLCRRDRETKLIRRV